jgi:hypothetical protein
MNILAQVKEVRRAAVDPAYFIDNYCHVLNPTEGNTLMTLSDQQHRWVQQFQEQKITEVAELRQTGRTSLIAAYAVWHVIFSKANNTLLLSNSFINLKHVRSIIDHMYGQLPTWMAPGLKVNNRSRIELNNGSRIIFGITSEKVGRGLSVDMLLVDNVNYSSPIEVLKFREAILPTMIGRCKIIMVGTVGR